LGGFFGFSEQGTNLRTEIIAVLFALAFIWPTLQALLSQRSVYGVSKGGKTGRK
jgi:xanthine/uracil/vitamin C permease (AzgA family)